MGVGALDVTAVSIGRPMASAGATADIMEVIDRGGDTHTVLLAASRR